jgi:hypothetical protein
LSGIAARPPERDQARDGGQALYEIAQQLMLFKPRQPRYIKSRSNLCFSSGVSRAV